ncbi:MAG: hypothetical protein B6D37_00815 [Sphingobacteriales bacterium UTBCD1]|jgi:hypothetical protein|nr:MAG: hypothetical protein B6D37_00815 [Sphingobacteriales bacterium UTBCD1]
MEHETHQNPSRRKFIFLGAGIIAFFSVFKFLHTGKKKKTIKMLSQDGRLVTLNEEMLPSKRKKITNRELQNWINHNK